MNGQLFTSVGLDFLRGFALSLGIGLLMGLERERNPSARAGLRTFGLTALLGTVSALIAEHTQSPWILAAGMVVVGGMMISAYLSHPDDRDPGTTSVVALLLCYGYGAMVWYDYRTLAVMLGILTTVILYFKAELEQFTTALTRRDITSILQFAVLSLVILPTLPNQGFGPYDAINPYQVWWMVVLISGVSLAGYGALRVVGQRHSGALLGVLGGLVSSTATTLVFSRHAREDINLARLAVVVILTANLVVMARLTILAAVLQPALVPKLAPILACGAVAGMLVGIQAWRRLAKPGDMPQLDLRNPTEIRTALTFGVAYAVVLFLSAWLGDIAGSTGLYGVALVSGLTDVDAITLSALRLFGLGRVGAEEAVTAIVLAVSANLCFKLGVVLTVARAQLGGWISSGFLAVGLGLAGGWAILA